jgi:hypothetical protein
MRTGISITVTASELLRLEAIVVNRNSPQKHVWRCRIVLLTATGAGTAPPLWRAVRLDALPASSKTIFI